MTRRRACRQFINDFIGGDVAIEHDAVAVDNSGMPAATRTLVADRGDAGVRLDRVIRRHLAGDAAATRTRIQRWIESGGVTVNGAPATHTSARAACGDVIELAVQQTHARRVMEAEPLALSVLYEDDHLIA